MYKLFELIKIEMWKNHFETAVVSEIDDKGNIIRYRYFDGVDVLRESINDKIGYKIIKNNGEILQEEFMEAWRLA
jgi:hypothetical protein